MDQPTIDLNHPISFRMMQIFLKSSRFFITISTFLLLILFILSLVSESAHNGFYGLAIGLIFWGINLYYSGRLWLDSALIKSLMENIAEDPSCRQFDQTLQFILSGKSNLSLSKRSLKSRFLGMRRLLFKAIFSLIIQFLEIILLLIFYF